MTEEIQNQESPYLFRYRPMRETTLEEIEESYIYFSSREQLNDPFDSSDAYIILKDGKREIDGYLNAIREEAGRLGLRSQLSKLPKGDSAFYSYFKEALRHFIRKYGIACFTISPVLTNLWAGYAGGHEGICIQYNTALDPEFFEGVRPVQYVDRMDPVEFEVANNGPAFEKLFFSKASSWSNELEVRLLKATSGKHHLNPLSIRSIALGTKISDAYKQQVLEIVRHKLKHVKVYETVQLSNAFGYRFSLLN